MQYVITFLPNILKITKMPNFKNQMLKKLYKAQCQFSFKATMTAS